MHEIKKRMPIYFKQELNHAARLMDFTPKPGTAPVKAYLPTATTPGIRVYLTLGENRMQHFMVPTVEAVSIQADEQAALRYQLSSRKLDATVLKRWLATMYPPAVMDGHGGMEKVSGSLTYTLAGESASHRYATLRGTVKLELDNTSRISYQGPCNLVLRYTKESDELESVWGTFTTKIPRVDQRGNSVEHVPMTVAIEPIK